MKKNNYFKKLLSLSLSVTIIFSLLLGGTTSALAADLSIYKTVYYSDQLNMSLPRTLTADDPAHDNSSVTYALAGSLDSGYYMIDAPSTPTYYYNVLRKGRQYKPDGKYFYTIFEWDKVAEAIFNQRLNTDSDVKKLMNGTYASTLLECINKMGARTFGLVRETAYEADKYVGTLNYWSSDGGLKEAQNKLERTIANQIVNTQNNNESDLPTFHGVSDLNNHTTGPVVTLHHIAYKNTAPPISYAGFAVYFYNFRVRPMVLDNTDEATYSVTTKTTAEQDLGITSYVDNMSDLTAKKSVSLSKGSEYTAENTVANSSSYTLAKSHSFSIGEEIGLSDFAKMNVTTTTGFTSSKAFEIGWTSGKSVSYDGKVTVTDEIEVPANTRAQISTKASTVTATTYYACPCAISFDAMIVAYSGSKSKFDLYNPGSKIIATFSGSELCDARSDIKGRAYLNYGAPSGEIQTNWDALKSDKTISDAIYYVSNYIPIGKNAGLMEESYTEYSSEILPYIPLNALDTIKIPYADRTKTVKVGKSFDTSQISMTAYGNLIDYYGFKSRNGEWKVTDQDGNVISSSILSVDSDGVVKALKEGTAYLTYFIKENCYTSAEDTSVYASNESVKRPTIQVTVTPVNYTVKYQANGGTGTKDPVSVKEKTDYKIASNPFKKTGYTFMGWNTRADGKGTAYKAGTTVKNLTEAGKTITLYAQWKVTPLAVGKSFTMSNGNKIKVLTYNKKYDTGTVLFTPKKGATTITVPSTVKVKGVTYKVTQLSASIYLNNKNASEVTIGKYVTAIKDNTFKNLAKLKTVTIGAAVSEIGKSAFYGCKNLTKCNIKTTKLSSSKVGEKAFTKTNAKIKVYVPFSKLSSYKKLLVEKGVSSEATFTKLP